MSLQMIRSFVMSGIASTVALACACGTASAEVKVNGATTVTFGLMKPHKDKIEQNAGVTLAILPSSTTRGLTDLALGRADIAMLAEPLETAAESVNKKQPGTVDADQLVGKHVGNAYVQFIIHPSNPVQKLSKEQLAGLFSGKIKNWAEVGGADQAVLIVGEPTSSPHKMISDALATAYAPDLRVVQNTNQTATIVSQAPGALSYITTAHDLPERSKLKVVDSEVKLPLALYLAFRKDASSDVKKVVEAAAAVATP
jgi:phosphate transport system substrate-binding protein